jgi:hypothetical protein
LITPHGDARATPAGIIWEDVAIRPLIENLPKGGNPIRPDVPLTEIEPVKASGVAAKQLERGKLTNGKPLSILGHEFDEGFGTPCNISLTYRLDPSWKRFVTVVGLADNWQGVGPYEILLDEKPHFQTTAPSTFGRNTPGSQLEVPIPTGHKTITLKVKGESSLAAWANAGFMKE